MSTPINTIYLGPRARRIVRFAAKFVNPLGLLFAGRRWMPVVGILRHRGRRSGREYATPIGMRPLGDSFVIPRTFSDNAAWYQNVKAAGEGRITYLGRHYRVVEPEVVDYATARPAFPGYELLQFRLIGINEYLRLRVVPEAVDQIPKEKVQMEKRVAIEPCAARKLRQPRQMSLTTPRWVPGGIA
jgi:deazaflavin-dependent oxidoreductase (nitroreductase family)